MASTTTTAVVVAPQSGPVIITHQPMPPRGTCLAVTQLVIGVITVILGIAARASLSVLHTVTINAGVGIWAGAWISITGIVGISYSRNPSRGGLNGIYVALSVISSLVSAVAGIFFIVAVLYYTVAHSCNYITIGRYVRNRDCDYNSTGLGLHVPMLLLMIVEFFISIIACCCSCGNCCGRAEAGTVIVQQPQQQQIAVVTTSAASAQMAPQYGGQMAPQYGGQMAPQYGGQMAPQYGGQMPPQYNNQVPTKPVVSNY